MERCLLPDVAPSCPRVARCLVLRSFALAATRVSPHLLNLKAYAPKCRASRRGLQTEKNKQKEKQKEKGSRVGIERRRRPIPDSATLSKAPSQQHLTPCDSPILSLSHSFALPSASTSYSLGISLLLSLSAASSTALFMGCLGSLNKSSCSCSSFEAATLPSPQLDFVGIRTQLVQGLEITLEHTL